MMWLKWFPWRFVLRRAALAHGFLDPIAVLGRLQRFTQPAEVQEPIELLRAGVVLHARGLINSRVIQHNLDWVWPYWVERQFDPQDDAFVPRAFSVTHINLTHRNWTAVGLPDIAEFPIVDPRGLLTPLHDGWSLDGWVVTEDGRALLPSRAKDCRQRLDLDDTLAVATETELEGLALASRAEVCDESGRPVCRLTLEARADRPGWLILALRPYNPEGISFIHEAELSADRQAWTVDAKGRVEFDTPVDRHHMSAYRSGDVYIHLHDLEDQPRGRCGVGMVTAAALFELTPGRPRQVQAQVPLPCSAEAALRGAKGWAAHLEGYAKAEIPDARFRFLYEAAIRTLVLHTPDDAYPGPYTYKHFWFRDSAFILFALLCAGFTDRVERALDRFPARQTALGYFHSQEGEWDSNGQALWIIDKFHELAGRAPDPRWWRPIERGARWIARKRLPAAGGGPAAGLLPAGFSAEHLGPVDFYYWDDFWGIAGLRAAARLAQGLGHDAAGESFVAEAEAFQGCVERSLEAAAKRLGRPAMPAAPERRLDAGAIGSLAIGHPLGLCAPDDQRLLDTARFLLDNCMVEGGFFQDMIHSGINPYLSLHIAQVLLRAGDLAYLDIMETVADMASPTGQWPEAIHPRTRGGCMGDGQHVWAAAEWVLMIRNCFVREEGDRLILASGIPRAWLRAGEVLRYGPAPTAFGRISLTIDCSAEAVRVAWQGTWHGAPPVLEVRLSGFEAREADPDHGFLEVQLGAVA